MKNYFFLILMACGLCSQAQGNLTITVADSTTGLPIGGVRVLYYFSTEAFYGTGNTKPPTYEQFDYAAFTDTNGVISVSVASRTPGDTLFWATKDCSGNYFWGSDTIPTGNTNIADTIKSPAHQAIVMWYSG
jgi:hypothetical protein